MKLIKHKSFNVAPQVVVPQAADPQLREASYAAAQRVWGVIILFGATILSVLISHFWH
jgi:hypothetical protein